MTIGRTVPRVTSVPLLQWSNGKLDAAIAGSSRFSAGFVGWYMEQGTNDELDGLMAEASTATVQIRHPRAGQNPPYAVKTHWSIGERVNFYPLTRGPSAPVVAQCKPREMANAGIGLKWVENRSNLRIWGYINVGGQYVLVCIPLRGRITDYAVTALIDHMRVVEAADTLVNRTKHPEQVDLYEVALPLIAGDTEPFGKGETTMVTTIVSGHPTDITTDYIGQTWAKGIAAKNIMDDWALVMQLAWHFTMAVGDIVEGEQEE